MSITYDKVTPLNVWQRKFAFVKCKSPTVVIFEGERTMVSTYLIMQHYWTKTINSATKGFITVIFSDDEYVAEWNRDLFTQLDIRFSGKNTRWKYEDFRGYALSGLSVDEAIIAEYNTSNIEHMGKELEVLLNTFNISWIGNFTVDLGRLVDSLRNGGTTSVEEILRFMVNLKAKGKLNVGVKENEFLLKANNFTVEIKGELPGARRIKYTIGERSHELT